MKVLVTCPPMLGLIEEFRPEFKAKGIDLLTPDIVQTLSEEELMEILPTVDGWIIGDDPATRQVFEAGKKGIFKAAVKWGVGTDNVDFDACKDLNIPVTNTPNMFGAEVAGIAVSYVIGLARQTYQIHEGVKEGKWIKPAGISLSGRTVAIIGFGDIGKATAKRLKAFDLNINIYDPYASKSDQDQADYSFLTWPEKLGEADFVVATCSLNDDTRHMINKSTLAQMMDGVRIVNVSRGPIIKEADLIQALTAGKVFAAGLDVFEEEPLPLDSPLRAFEKCIFGTHNGSNTIDGVRRATKQAMASMFEFLGV